MRFLITGGGSDIGKAIASAILSAGHKVIVTSSTAVTQESLQKVYSDEDLKSEYMIFDLAKPEESGQALEILLEEGPIDGVILNACTRVPRLKRFGDLPFEDSSTFINTNMHGNLWLLHRLIKAQMKTQLGRNVFISSTSATMGSSRYGVYCLVKAGMEGFFRNLAVDYGSSNLYFNVLRPGIIETSRHTDARKRAGYEESIIHRIPAGKCGVPHQVARALMPLIDPETYINGAHLEVSGGLPLFRTDVS